MTVANETITSGPYTGDGVTTDFSYDFKITTGNDIAVYETDLSGVITLLTPITDYTPNNVGEENGTITLTSPLTNGHKLLLVGDYSSTQDTAFKSQGAFFPIIHEDAMDKLTRLVQQLKYMVGNGLRLPAGYAGDASTELPVPEDKKLLRYSNTANAFINTLISELLAESDAIQSDLQMNGNRVTNMGDGVDAQDAATIQQLTDVEGSAGQSAAEAAQSAQEASDTLDDFRNIYWGAYSSEPSLSPTGDPATTGDLYFNTTEGLMKTYDDDAGIWLNTASAVNGIRSEGSFTNVAGQDTFAFNYDPNYVDVFYNGQRLQKAIDFDGTSGTQIVLTNPVSASTDRITIVAFNNVDFADLGTAASRDVQTSPTDTTAGRLMAVGAFGLGGDTPIENDVDLDAEKEAGRIIFAASAAALPPELSAAMVEVLAGSTSPTSFRVLQRASGYSASTIGLVFVRGWDGSMWTSWKPYYTGANYQPETSLNGLGVVRFMRNNSGGLIADSGSVAGTSLNVVYFDSTGQGQASGATGTGTWKNVTGRAMSNLEYGLFVRTA